MKISSVSKKVLASALSAAMVVAFAPTVAFGAAVPVKVTVDLSDGTVVSGNTEFPNATQDITITLPTVKKDGVAGIWKYDNNGDGAIDKKDAVIAGGSLNLANVGTDVTVKAFYEQPALGDIEIDADGKLTAEVKGCDSIQTGANTLKVAFYGSTGAQLGADVAITSAIDAGAKATAKTADAIAAKGYYTVSLLQKQENGSYKEIGTQVVEVCQVKDGAGTAQYAVVGQTVTLANASYDEATGIAYPASGSYKVDGNKEFKAVTGAFAVVDTAYDKDSRTIVIDPKSNATATNSGTYNGYEASYKLSITSDCGVSFAEAAVTGDTTISFKQDAATAKFSGEEKAGTYTMTVTETLTKSGQADVVNVNKSQFTLSEVAFSAGDGTFKPAFTGKGYFTSGATVTTLPTLTGNVNAPAGKKLDTTYEWVLGDKKYAEGTGISAALNAGAVNTFTPNFVVDNAKVLSAPTIESVVKGTDGKYTVKFGNIPAGATVKYSVDGSAPSVKYNTATGITQIDITTLANPIKVISEAVPGVTAAGYATTTTPVEYVLVGNNLDAFNAMVKGATSALELYVGNTADKWKAQAGVKAAVDAVNAEAEKTVFATATAWGTMATNGAKAVYEATVKAASDILAPYADEAYVAVGTKVYTMKAADLKAATDSIAAQATKAAKATSVADYQACVGTIVNATNKALKAATDTKLAASDVEAAAAVTAQLQAAKTGAEAEAALAAYAALTDAQKKLVATADVAKAEAVVAEAKAAAELKDAQDEAAVAKTRNASKTVKLAKGKTKTTKKQSITLKAITSKSGAKVTYKKVSGKKAITVKSGKAYLAKGTKAGKYAATVKATCGTQTAKIKVTFKVVK